MTNDPAKRERMNDEARNSRAALRPGFSSFGFRISFVIHSFPLSGIIRHFSRFHPHFSLAIIHQGIEVFLDLGYAEDLFDGGHTIAHLVPAVGPQGAHTHLDGLLGDGRGGHAIEDQRPQGLVENQQFVDAHAPLVPKLPAFLTAYAVPKFGPRDLIRWKTDPPQVTALHFLLLFAMGADGGDQALGYDGFDRGSDQERLDAHVNQPGKGAGGVIGVERAEDEVAGQGGADGDLRRLQVADFADHDDVWVLAQNMAQAHGKGQADFRPNGDLVNAFEFVFDGFLDGDDALVDRVDGAQEGIKRSGFARAGRAGDQKNPVRLDDDFPNRLLLQG